MDSCLTTFFFLVWSKENDRQVITSCTHSLPYPFISTSVLYNHQITHIYTHCMVLCGHRATSLYLGLRGRSTRFHFNNTNTSSPRHHHLGRCVCLAHRHGLPGRRRWAVASSPVPSGSPRRRHCRRLPWSARAGPLQMVSHLVSAALVTICFQFFLDL